MKKDEIPLAKRQSILLVWFILICSCSDIGVDIPKVYSVAFASRHPGGTSDIYLIDSDGENFRAITAHPAMDENPKWSPDGQKIVCQGNVDWNEDIYIINVATGDTIRLTNHTAADITPKWNPDGSKIAFVSMRDGNGEIYTLQSDGALLTRLTHASRMDLEPVWSPDGMRIAFTTHRKSDDEHVYIIPSHGGDALQLVTTNSDEYNPTWSLDGETLYFYNISLGKIYSIPTDGKRTPEIIFDFGRAEDLSLSPDGKVLVFAATVGESTAAAVYLLNLESYDFKLVSRSTGSDRTPVIQPSF